MTEPKRLLLVCETYPPRHLGQEIAAQRLARAIHALGLRVEVLTQDFHPEGSTREPVPGRWQTVIEPDWITVTRIASTDMPVHLTWLNQTLEARGPADAVIVFGLGAYAMPAAMAAHGWGVPVLAWARGSDANRDLFQPARVDSLIVALRLATRVAAVSQEMARLLTAYSHAPVLAWSNTVDRTRFRPPADKRALRRSLQLPDEALLIGFTGQFRGVKGMGAILAGFHRLRQRRPDAQLVVVGEVDNRDRATFDQWCQAHRGSAAALRLIPFVEPSRMPEVMGSFDQVWFPSLLEGSSNSILEAMACGVPVIATPVGGNREVVHHGETGMVVPAGDGEALAAAALELLADPVRAQAMAARAMQGLAERHDPTLERDRLLAVAREFGLLPPDHGSGPQPSPIAAP